MTADRSPFDLGAYEPWAVDGAFRWTVDGVWDHVAHQRDPAGRVYFDPPPGWAVGVLVDVIVRCGSLAGMIVTAYDGNTIALRCPDCGWTTDPFDRPTLTELRTLTPDVPCVGEITRRGRVIGVEPVGFQFVVTVQVEGDPLVSHPATVRVSDQEGPHRD